MSEQGLTLVEPPGRQESSWRPGKELIVRAALGLVLLLAAGAGIWVLSYPDRVGPSREAPVVVDIPRGIGVAGIKQILAGAGVIDDDIRFVLLAKWQGASKKLKAGEYAFAPGMSPRAVLSLIASGKTVQHAVTLPEGVTVAQAAEIISRGGWGSREDFLRLAADSGFLRDMGIAQSSAEGYFFPDTYFFTKGTSLRSILTTVLKRMGQVLAEEGVRGEGNLVGAVGSVVVDKQSGSGEKSLSLSRHEVLTLASIVEKEAALPDERPLVARVFLNRLRLGMKLQADPTVIYGLAKFGSPLTRSDLETPNPYNTYVNRGLPVGPICNPGRTAIRAVLHPSSEDYRYFVAQGDGTHYFSKTLAEHNQAVSRYRKKRLSNKE